ncbi:hypothetical protein IPA_01785 [Ignicoccus pacificus DSM 13166]|uniref:DUF83 domain-containing protein n=1 Tax=Ignicoccus pacificus DSM 13166 TaxID=940294 RepID=A0A977KAJ9_9CREN|nr:hypothetical protein IPA_01785 [Ignicoccus pacificus DSM 13166]
MDERDLLKMILTPILERAKEDRMQSEDDREDVVHVSKLSRGCVKFKENRLFEDDVDTFIESLLKGENNSISWLLGQLVHASIEGLTDHKVIDGCQLIAEKEVFKKVRISCPPHEVTVVGHVDLYASCPQGDFAVELKYRGGGELGLRSLYQTKVYSAALGVPVYIIIITPEKVKVEKVEADEAFLQDIVDRFKCKGLIEEIVFNPDARPCNNCALREQCDVWKRTVSVLLSKIS